MIATITATRNMVTREITNEIRSTTVRSSSMARPDPVQGGVGEARSWRLAPNRLLRRGRSAAVAEQPDLLHVGDVAVDRPLGERALLGPFQPDALGELAVRLDVLVRPLVQGDAFGGKLLGGLLVLD